MTYTSAEQISEHSAVRVRLVTDARFAALVTAVEQAVPELSDADAVRRLARSRDWTDFTRGLAWESPSGFVRTRAEHPSELLHAAGGDVPSVCWTLVNHAVTARIFRLDPGIVVHSAVRLEMHAARDAGTVVGFDVPSSALRSFGLAKIAQAGAELDRALGDLLEDVGLPRPSALRR